MGSYYQGVEVRHLVSPVGSYYQEVEEILPGRAHTFMSAASRKRQTGGSSSPQVVEARIPQRAHADTSLASQERQTGAVGSFLTCGPGPAFRAHDNRPPVSLEGKKDPGTSPQATGQSPQIRTQDHVFLASCEGKTSEGSLFQTMEFGVPIRRSYTSSDPLPRQKDLGGCSQPAQQSTPFSASSISPQGMNLGDLSPHTFEQTAAARSHAEVNEASVSPQGGHLFLDLSYAAERPSTGRRQDQTPPDLVDIKSASESHIITPIHVSGPSVSERWQAFKQGQFL